MSGPIVDPSAEKRIIRHTEAAKIAHAWTEKLKAERQSAGLFSIMVPQCEESTLAIGVIDEKLREKGFQIASHSHFVMGKDANNMLALNVSLLIRSTDGKASQIVLG